MSLNLPACRFRSLYDQPCHAFLPHPIQSVFRQHIEWRFDVIKLVLRFGWVTYSTWQIKVVILLVNNEEPPSVKAYGDVH